MLKECLTDMYGPLEVGNSKDTLEDSEDITCTFASLSQKKDSSSKNSNPKKNQYNFKKTDDEFDFGNNSNNNNTLNSSVDSCDSSAFNIQMPVVIRNNNCNKKVLSENTLKENTNLEKNIQKNTILNNPVPDTVFTGKSKLTLRNNRENITEINSANRNIARIDRPNTSLNSSINANSSIFEQPTLREILNKSSNNQTTDDGSRKTTHIEIDKDKHKMSFTSCQKDAGNNIKRMTSTQNSGISNKNVSFENISNISQADEIRLLEEVFANDSDFGPLSSFIKTPTPKKQNSNDHSNNAINITNQKNMHESIVGDDGLPIYKIAKLPESSKTGSVFSNAKNSSKTTSLDENIEDLSRRNVTLSLAKKSEDNTLLNKNTDYKNQQNSAIFENAGNKQQLNASKSLSLSLNKGNLNNPKPNDLEMDDLPNWSKGTVISNFSNIQNVELARPQTVNITENKTNNSNLLKRPNTSNNTKDEPDKKKKAKMNIFDSMKYEIVCGKQVKKATSAFSLFANDVRHEVLSENPGADFTVIGQAIAAKWKLLDKETKQMYTDLAANDQLRYQADIRKVHNEKNSTLLAYTSFNKDNAGQKRSLDRLVAPLTPELRKNNSIVKKEISVFDKSSQQTKIIDLNINDLKKKVEKCGYKNANDDLNIIGSVGGKIGWFCHYEETIFAINPARLHESILYQSLMSTFPLPSPTLGSPITFNSSSLGDKLWNTLLSLKKEKVADHVFFQTVDERIIQNGFRLLLFPMDNDVFSHGEIKGLADCIGFYGLKDLQEILEKIQDNPDISVLKSRPLKVQHYMKSEAVRVARSSPNLQNISDLKEKLNKLFAINGFKGLVSEESKTSCLHGRPIFTTVFNLEDIPLSQSQSSQVDQID